MYDLILKNARAVTENGVISADIAVKDGKIAAWFEAGSLLEAAETVECGGKYVFPGIVDMHFHCRVPGRSDREDFDTASMSAAKGGVTTLIEMPIARPSPHDAQTFRARVDYASSRSVVDYGFYGAGATMDPERAWELARAGAIGFKIFLHQSPAGREDEFDSLCAVGTCELTRSFEANAETGLVTCVHCEDDGMIRALTARYGKGGRNTWREQMLTRPPEAEELAILTAGKCAENAGARLHICHISSSRGARALSYLKEEGLAITGETCPQYLFGDDSWPEKWGAFARVNPPIRGEKDRLDLMQAIRSGQIDAVASDHAPFLPEEKKVSDYLSAPSGIPGVEFFGPLVLEQVLDGTFMPEEAVRAMCRRPAEILGLYPEKGSILPGSDADFFIFDPGRDYEFHMAESFSKSAGSLPMFEGRVFRGCLERTFVRGREVFSDGKILAERGYGRWIPGARYRK